MTYEPKDVAVLAELEEKTREFIAFAQTAAEALERLDAAGFDGAAWVLTHLPAATREDDSPCDGTPWALIDALVPTQQAGGDEITLSWLLEVAH